MLNLSYTNFKKEVLDSELPVVVGCYLTGDSSENMMLLLEALSKGYNQRVKFTKLDAREHSRLAGQYNVERAPTILFFHEGKEFDRIVGSMPKSMLELQLSMVIEKLYSRMVKKIK